MSDWQPIETAPKDGTHFLGFQPGGQTWKPYVDIFRYFRWSDGRYELQVGRDENHPDTLTHWMPLPEHPK